MCRVLAALGVALSTVVVCACENVDARGALPTTASAPTGLPTAPPAITSVVVVSPVPGLRPGESAQFVAIATMSSGPNQSVTALGEWRSFNPDVATVSATGLVSAIAPGDARIGIEYRGVTGATTLEVSGTSQVAAGVCGVILEAETERRIAEARVQITGGTGAGRVAMSDAGGAYCLEGLEPGVSILRASRSGYEPAERRVTVEGRHTLNFELRPAVTP